MKIRKFKVIKPYAGIEIGTEVPMSDTMKINYMINRKYWEEIEIIEPPVIQEPEPELFVAKVDAPKIENKIPRQIKRRKRK